MHMQNDILPADFTGTFYFTNSSKEDFEGVWGGKKYLFPAESTVPMVIADQTPREIQSIRKKFAKDYAEREFYKSKGYKTLAGQEGKSGHRTMNSIHQAAVYVGKDLEPYIESCLKPLKLASLKSETVEKIPLEAKLSRNEKDELNSEAIDAKASLRAKALNS
jgi:hypothetical protein